MKSRFQNVVRLGAVGLIAATVVTAGCRSSSTRTTAQKIGDRQVTRAVNKSLAEDPTFKYTDVKPNVYEGTVQLTGFVETPEQRLRAAELASRTKGVRQVINEIMIKPMPTGPATVRDPLGQDTGHLLVDTNSPVQRMRNLPESQTTPQQPAPGSTPEPSNPK